MSAANNLSKSGSKSCGSPDEYFDDEIVNWLQYPLGDSIEKGYCYELFGQWPSSSASMVKQPAAVGSSKLPATSLMDVSSCTYTQMGSHWRSDLASVSMDSGTCNAKDSAGRGHSLARATSAEGALAMGAERAAGLVSQTGRDEFSKVRTSMQPPAGSHISPFSGLQSVSIPDPSFHSGNMAPHGLPTGKGCSTIQCRGSSPSKPPSSIPNYATTVSSGLASLGSNAMMSNFGCFTAFKPRNSSQVPLQMPTVQESGSSHVTADEMNVRRAADYSSSASSCGQPSTGQSAAVMAARFTPLAMEAAVRSMPDMALTAASGRSLSATTLSTRETSSNSGKRKIDDADSQSEDIEGESSIDIRQPRKPSSSKRNRAAEVHNLSERNRRNRINEKLKALQDLIPNSNKTDKASVLDEAIEYMKTLQMQLQMVSLRSGMTASPMMIPLGMPHLQMAPLHPVGLGVPVGHPGLGVGIGLQMSMGMGTVDLHQAMPARPSQSASVSPSPFSMTPQVRNGPGLQECSLDSMNVGLTPSQLVPLSYGPSQVHSALNISPNVYLRQQQHQWQYTGQHSEGRESFNEQVGKEE